ncbi:MAG TPA: hypothetical protein VD908_03880 [Cytophagales bacterium]|nr:hypothetical protein [Cytophagales bacterium]
MEKTLNETKSELVRKTEVYKHTIENQINELKGDATKIGKVALIAGGIILITYFLIKGSKKGDKNLKSKKVIMLDGEKYAISSAQNESFIVKAIRKYMIIFLASLAKQKLALYLQKLNNNTSNVEANSPKTFELQEKGS